MTVTWIEADPQHLLRVHPEAQSGQFAQIPLFWPEFRNSSDLAEFSGVVNPREKPDLAEFLDETRTSEKL